MGGGLWCPLTETMLNTSCPCCLFPKDSLPSFCTFIHVVCWFVSMRMVNGGGSRGSEDPRIPSRNGVQVRIENIDHVTC